LAYDDDGNPTEPEWPEADIIIGNPPFIGGNKIRQELGDKTVDSLFKLYDGRIPAFADLVCYWFEKARAQIERGVTQRAGLIATNSIRGGANREVLKRIKETGDIFMAWSDNPWTLNGAAVRVSIVGFDNGSAQLKYLDNGQVVEINADLTSSADITQALQLAENAKICFIGTKKAGPFDVDEHFASKLIKASNSSDYKNSNVIFPWLNGQSIVRRMEPKWVIYFGDLSQEEAACYKEPFAYVKNMILPIREKNNEERARRLWWQHRRPATEMREETSKLTRFIATPRVSKFRLYAWVPSNTLPDDGIYVFAREDDYFFGVLHSRLHEVWALRMGTSLEDRPRYTPTTTFETFPFPWPPGHEPSETEDVRVAEIAHWARELHQWREAWLNPPPPASNVIDVAYEKMVKNRTLTNLYNGLVYYRETVKAGKLFDRAAFDKETRKSVSRAAIEELDDIHTALDVAVLDAYGWPHTLSDEQILERLLALNLARARG
ncbi:MAG: hypothetical protein KDE56_29935, partial [Anaerolineales bacterium]|nr:hypothetical protein [Anaerolineales bacterium]